MHKALAAIAITGLFALVALAGLSVLGAVPFANATCGPAVTLTLAPSTQTLPAGSSATVTATFCGLPSTGATIDFNVISGPNVGKTGLPTTNNGQATFTYLDSGGAGTDMIGASTTSDGGVSSLPVSVVWTSTSGVPQFPLGSLAFVALIAAMLPLLWLVRARRGMGTGSRL